MATHIIRYLSVNAFVLLFSINVFTKLFNHLDRNLSMLQNSDILKVIKQHSCFNNKENRYGKKVAVQTEVRV